MISIITAVHNQIAMNRIFLESIERYTRNLFELIVVDNNSTDGSREFFGKAKAVVIENDGNYSYPYCQNRGIEAARYHILAFLNNDVIVPPGWDEKIVLAMEENDLDIITPCGIERLESREATRRYKRKWKMIRNLIGTFGNTNFTLRLMHRLMYGDWGEFSRKRFDRFSYNVIEGFVANSVIMTRKAVDKVGMWDERVQSAGWDLCIRSKKRSLDVGDIKPVHIALGVFTHHFIRLTLKSSPPPFKDGGRLMALDEKWDSESIAKYLCV